MTPRRGNLFHSLVRHVVVLRAGAQAVDVGAAGWPSWVVAGAARYWTQPVPDVPR